MTPRARLTAHGREDERRESGFIVSRQEARFKRWFC
jgi:hypothetical protein